MATINIVQRTKQLSNGKFGIYLRFTKDRKNSFIYLNMSASEVDWNPKKQEFRKSYRDYIQKNSSLDKIRSRAESILSKSYENEQDLNADEFKSLFLEYKNDAKITVYDFWEDFISDLIKSGRTGTAKFYKEARHTLFSFVGNREINFKDITPNLLSKFEVYLRARGNKESGIAVRMRALRSIFNKAIANGVVKKDFYPFITYKVSKLKSEPEKRALTLEDMNKIIECDLSNHTHLKDSKNYFLFSYYTGGINFVDMMKLTWDNIQGNRIKYIRSKTKVNLDITILPPVMEILYYYKQQVSNTNYIFPILLQENLTPSQIENRKFKTLKQYNSDLKEIAKISNVEEVLTSYVARHSFATNLWAKGVSYDIISKLMKHNSPDITMKYLKSFNNKDIDNAMNQLL